jgi:hypothetical protein
MHCNRHLSQQIPEDASEKQTIELSSNMFHVGEMLLYTNEGHTTYVRVDKIFLDDGAVLRFHVRTKDEKLITTTWESLRAPDASDIRWIPSTVPDRREAVSDLSEREIKQLSNPVSLSPLQEDFLALHERLWHLPFFSNVSSCQDRVPSKEVFQVEQ